MRHDLMQNHRNAFYKLVMCKDEVACLLLEEVTMRGEYIHRYKLQVLHTLAANKSTVSMYKIYIQLYAQQIQVKTCITISINYILGQKLFSYFEVPCMLIFFLFIADF